MIKRNHFLFALDFESVLAQHLTFQGFLVKPRFITEKLTLGFLQILSSKVKNFFSFKDPIPDDLKPQCGM